MKLNIRRTLTIVDQMPGETPTAPLLRRLAVVAIVENPYVGQYVEDLGAFVAASVEIGAEMARIAADAYGGFEVQSYGKAGMVGIGGEQEHANALLTTAFAQPFREQFGGKAWISSVTKIAVPGELLDVPMNNVDDVYVRSHYGTMSLTVPGAPLPDEIALVFCIASRGRVNG